MFICNHGRASLCRAPRFRSGIADVAASHLNRESQQQSSDHQTVNSDGPHHANNSERRVPEHDGAKYDSRQSTQNQQHLVPISFLKLIALMIFNIPVIIAQAPITIARLRAATPGQNAV